MQPAMAKGLPCDADHIVAPTWRKTAEALYEGVQIFVGKRGPYVFEEAVELSQVGFLRDVLHASSALQGNESLEVRAEPAPVADGHGVLSGHSVATSSRRGWSSFAYVATLSSDRCPRRSAIVLSDSP